MFVIGWLNMETVDAEVGFSGVYLAVGRYRDGYPSFDRGLYLRDVTQTLRAICSLGVAPGVLDARFAPGHQSSRPTVGKFDDETKTGRKIRLRSESGLENSDSMRMKLSRSFINRIWIFEAYCIYYRRNMNIT